MIQVNTWQWYLLSWLYTEYVQKDTWMYPEEHRTENIIHNQVGYAP